ncbi:TonB-dependent siderophore receptor [Pseudoxanthomonas broegbernensis]|uniref:TonB-dependent siderophore receptor n=1 Tax=Pseudoxanthomonas broegbernensis TaxID=83619 RepID=A0A7V8GKA4_9GAMM|nr:catecholate siderophore receptor Fiu [Pseudoxanthomonas broegbernensis]KAF1684873.1 TonB-dependent siderophore receptor [Pseudoxanthomonas broegbernensis]MBB6065250.1 catecholate siderophore receptor [Pseudoxanthomonas broegbernensis]
MSHIRNRKHAPAAQCSLATATLLTGLALAAPVAAADTADLADRSGNATTLDGLEVKGVHGYKAERVVSPKFTQTLQDTPQTIQVITADLFNQQGATTLTEALRNSPGVGTFYAGENGNTSTGDTVYMRGFDSSSSIYADGVRDLGSISRDVFNTEQVEVTKGPAGTDNGRSSPTGSINMVSKQANLHDAVSATLSAGNDGQKRATADWNRSFAGLPGAALRLNAMWQDSDVAGRDRVDNQRHGLASSLAFGLDSSTRYYLNLLYVEQDNIPDGFVPTLGLPGWEPQPGLEGLAGHPVDPENFYGTRDDHDDVTAQMATFRFEHDFSDSLKLSNTLRWGQTEQDYLLTAFMSTGGTVADPRAGNIKWTDPADLSGYTLARSNSTFKDQRNRILTDQLNLRADFATGAVQHNLSTGLELTREEQDSHGIASTGSRPAANLYDPDWNDRGDLAWARSGAGSYGRTDTAALYLFDTLKFGERFLLTAGLRADRYETQYRNSAVCGGTGRGAVSCGSLPTGSIVQTVDTEDDDTLLTWKLGAVYKPAEAVSLYAGYALSQLPPGGANFQLSDAAGSASSINADPQKTKTFEVGSKWSLLDDALALNLALFRTEVTNEINSLVTDDAGLPTQTGEKQVKGVEISAVGNLTENWSISAGYTHQNTRVEEGAPVARNGSYNLTYTPEDAFTGWTTYRLPFGLTLGGGVRYSGEMLRGTDGAAGTPAFVKSYTVWDAVASYAVNDHLLLRLNGYNLFDKQYVASINKSGYRYTPGTPRTFLLSAELRF